MNKRRFFVMFAPLLACLTACATSLLKSAEDGPGMTVTFRNGLKGKSLLFDGAVSSTGARFTNPGSLAPSSDPMRGGKTEGAAPDSRQLPEWVEFTWHEAIYRGDYTREQLKALPRKTARVEVRSRVPQEVIAEVIESNHNRAPHKLPEKSLWVYFVWFESGIRFRWELKSDCCGVLRSGGDVIGDGN